MKLLILNGPNLNLLGVREPDIYGAQNYAALVAFVQAACREAGFDCEVYQSNHEGDLVDKIQAAYGCVDGIVINPAGGGSSVRCQRPGGLPTDFLCRDGLRQDIRRLRL